MRLIDADRLYRKVKMECNSYGKPSIGYDDGNKVLDWIQEMPTVDERKVGKWIDETFKPWGLVYHPYKCDQCGECSEADSDFCPNCGAKMEGDA